MATKRTAEPTANERDRSDALPEWKRTVWHSISEAAENKNVFGEVDYNDNGDLDMNLPKFEELYAWLASRRSKDQFERLSPAWRNIADNRWELTFFTVEGTIAQRRAAGTQSESEVTNVVRRKTTGIILEGLPREPEDDWVLVRSDKIPSHSELPQSGAGERNCDIM